MNIVDVIGARVRLKKSGNGMKGLCPFHAEKTPSFTVNPAKGLWHCFGCGAGGDAIEFLMRLDGISFKKAVEALGGEIDTRREDAFVPVAPAVDPRPLLSALWEMVSGASWSAEVADYLSSRSIEPDAAWVVGCRDWSRAALSRWGEPLGFEKIGKLIRSYPAEVQEAAGLAQGDKLWSPLWRRELGVAVPVWRLGEAYPWRWRWRTIAPREGAPKSLSCYSNGAAVDFLGAGLPVRLGLGGVVADDCYDVRAPGGSTLVLCEGEPDWLSAVQALDGAARAMAVCGGPRKWRDGWPTLYALRAHGVEHILVCVHEGLAVDGQVGHGMALAEDIAVRAVDVGITVRAALPSEGYDLNDMHRDGQLVDWFRSIGVGA